MCWTENDALRHDAIAHEVPQGDEQLARQGDDHLAGCYPRRWSHRLLNNYLSMDAVSSPLAS
jgi:hypothetical protein